MAIPESNLHQIQRERARRYKSEFVAKMYGVRFAAISRLSGAEKFFDFNAGDSNIVGLGFGRKEAGGGATDQVAVRVYVREKVASAALPGSEIVPKEVNGVPTDVIPVGELVAAARPTSCGVSVGHHSITAGTLGCLVRKPGESHVYILSNNHVLADCDRAAIGDLILEPAPDDGGKLDNPIAHLDDFEPLTNGTPKAMDAAIARLLDASAVRKDILVIGDVQPPPMQATLNQHVLKHGRTTGYTEGEIVDIAADIRVSFGHHRIEFENQLAIDGRGRPFADLGDSGSLVVDASSLRAVGLLFGVALGTGGTGFANPIVPILDRFGVEIL